MPRQARLDAPGALHHIMARGIDGALIFKDDNDRHFFLKRLGIILDETSTACYAWALLPNHFHLLMRTGAVQMATVMRRLMTGHAISFNKRHDRRGHLFQNRYKSILCQEDTYFLELVRYIHLNPLRANLVNSMEQLDTYRFTGHGVLMGRYQYDWQSIDPVLSVFGEDATAARVKYREFIAKGVGQGRRDDLTGGGLVRSSGGWLAVHQMRMAGIYSKSDERILGDSDFVNRVLSEADESFERRYHFKTRGIDVDYIAARVASLLGVREDEVWGGGRKRKAVIARSLICYLAVRELKSTMASLARRFNISLVAVSKSVERGARIIEKEKYDVKKLIS